MLHQILKMLMGNWKVALGAIGLLLMSHTLAYCTGKGDGRDAEKIKQAKVEAKALTKAREADSAAGATVKETTDAVEQSNQRARNAADVGLDPLGDGLRSLRREKAHPDPATD